jgi:hypothetical protein
VPNTERIFFIRHACVPASPSRRFSTSQKLTAGFWCRSEIVDFEEELAGAKN